MPYLRPEIMLIKHSRSKKPLQIMDPDCAICSQPAVAQCECEAKGLDIAVRQAEHRIMSSVFNDIRYASSLLCIVPYLDSLFLTEKEKSGLKPCLTAPGSAATPKTTSSNTSPCSPPAEKMPTPRASTPLPNTPTTTTAHTLTPPKSPPQTPISSAASTKTGERPCSDTRKCWNISTAWWI